MVNPNILISGGCSFSQVPGQVYKNWPVFLKDRLSIPSYFTGAGSAGNDLIAKRVIHRVTECMNNNKYKPENLLVGVMWSGIDRHGYYLQNEPNDYFRLANNSYSYGNPNSISCDYSYYMVKAGWPDELSNIYYKHFYDQLGNYILSLEHVLRLQWFLKLHDIKYFFTTYNDDSILGMDHEKFKHHPDVSSLVDQLDLSNFLPVQDMTFWNKNNSGHSFADLKDDHPNDEMSRDFCDKIIIPHLKSKGYVS